MRVMSTQRMMQGSSTAKGSHTADESLLLLFGLGGWGGGGEHKTMNKFYIFYAAYAGFRIVSNLNQVYAMLKIHQASISCTFPFL